MFRYRQGRRAAPFATQLWLWRHFLWQLTDANLKAQHAQTLLGQWWMLLNPLALGAIYFGLVFVLRGSADYAYFVHILSGVFFFYFFSVAINGATTSLTNSLGLISSYSFPRILIPFSSVLSALRRCGPVAIVLVGVTLPLGISNFWSRVGYLAVVTIIALVLTLALSLVVSTLQLRFRDTQFVVPLVLRVMVYLTPVLYLPTTLSPGALQVLGANPLFGVVAAWTAVWANEPQALGVLYPAMASVALFYVGWRYFNANEKHIGAHA